MSAVGLTLDERGDRSGTSRDHLHRLFDSLEGYVALGMGFGGYFDGGSYKFPDRQFREEFFPWPKEGEYLLGRVEEHLQKADTYICPLLRTKRSRKAGTGALGHYGWADIDGDAPRGWERRLLGPSSFVVGSGRGQHPYVWLPEPVGADEIEDLNKRFARALDADSGWSETKYLRLAGTLNHKPRALGGESAPVDFLEVVTGEQDWSIAELRELLSVDGGSGSGTASLNGNQPIEPREPERVPTTLLERRNEEPEAHPGRQSFWYVAACIDAGLADEEIMWLALEHKPTKAKFGNEKPEYDRRAKEIERSIRKVRTEPTAPDELPIPDSESVSESVEETASAIPEDVVARDAVSSRVGGAKSANAYLRSDLGNAELFADRHSAHLRHVKERRLWLVWEGGRWRGDTTGAAERATKALARERLRAAADVEGDDERKDAVKWAMASQSDPRIRAALSLATTESAIVLRAADLDVDPFLLACRNGTLDLRTGELRRPDPNDLITLGNDVAYDPDATCPRWKRFLIEVFDGDRKLIRFVQRLAGYSLTGDVREQIVAVLHGTGNNGKDTLIKPLLRVVGEQAETSPMDTFTRVRDRAVRNDLARLHRARLVIASESAEGRRLDEPTIKLVSGGGRVAARFLYGEFFEFTPMFKVWLITNHRPRVEGDDDAIWRRLRLIPFNVSFLGREDKELDAELEAEVPGILAWAVRGCTTWQKEGLGLPPAVEQATREYRVDEDVLGAFLAERCELEGEIEPAALRDAYDAFCSEIGERPLSANILGKRLAQRGIRREGANGAYRGVSLR